MNKEFWTYGTLYGRKGQQVFKINERAELLGIHAAAQILVEKVSPFKFGEIEGIENQGE